MSSSMKMYDVFLNFRGEDTRTIFISHLYTALNNKSIRTYIDDQLNRGDDVWPELAKAIENSQVSIVVFSENYATSKWCLEELVKILQCRKKDHGQVVIPVFYKIDPTHIRKQTGTFEKAFATHERDLRNDEAVQNKVSKWKAALAEAANISGWDSQIHKDDSQIIEHIVNDVLQKLSLRSPDELKGIVKTQENCTKVESLMKWVQVIGIWGMGGIGKTTIAKILFAKLFPQYDKVCFVANAKDYSFDMFLRELFKEETSTSNVVGSTFNMSRLSGKKVFIVLDNVDMNSDDLLENLCREYKDQSPNSRLIITTREMQLLTGRVDFIYKVDEWKHPESLQLFCSKAFNGSHPDRGFEDLSNRVVDYAGGVPLALDVLGSYLRSESVDFWEKTLEKLNKYPDKRIQTTLKVSYDRLDTLEKEIFLDIAFFFKGESKDHVIKLLDACGFHASTAINVLECKALITISNSNVIQIHDLLQQMGLEIVRELCSKDSGGRSRLRDTEEIHDVLGDNMGTDAIEGIILDLSQIKDIHLGVDTFKNMKKLRFLKFFVSSGQRYGNMHLPPDLGPFSNKLRYFEWHGYALASLPQDFCAKLLVEIRMPHSHVKQLWEGMQELGYLEGIDLSECKELLQLPDLSKAPRLKWVNLSGCGSLSDLHTSVLSADTLVTLILDRCIKLESVKAKKHLQSLKTISVNGCSSLEEFAVSSDLMENLDLSNTRIETLDKSIGLLHSLKWLNLEDLRLKHLPEELSRLTCLKELKLSNSGIVIDKQQLHVLFDGLQCLQILHLKNCSNLFELPDNIGVLKQLQELRLDGSNVNSLPTNINHLEVLEILSLENCRDLVCLPELPPLIKQLYAVNCMSLESISNLNTFARKMIGKTKHISFKNSLKLDEKSLYCIMESLHLTMVSAARHNVSVRKVPRYNYNSVEACFRGSKVPRHWQFSHHTTKSSITIELPKRTDLLGLIYSVVLSPSSGVKKNDVKIQCQCLPAEGNKASWQNICTTELKSDHVYVWYDPFHCDNILRFDESKVCFEFSVTTDAGKVDCSISIKECGVHLISVSEFYRVLPQQDLDSDKKKDLEKGFELESGCSIERHDDKESKGTRNQIQNQRNLREHCSSDGIVVEMSSRDDIRRLLRKARRPNVPASPGTAGSAVANPASATSPGSSTTSSGPPPPKRSRVAEPRSNVPVGGLRPGTMQPSTVAWTDNSSKRDARKGKGQASPSPVTSEGRSSEISETARYMAELCFPGEINQSLLPDEVKARFAELPAASLVRQVRRWAITTASVMKYLDAEVLPNASQEMVEKFKASYEAKLNKAEEIRAEQVHEAEQSLKAANDRADEANRSAGQKERELTDLQAELAGVRESLRLSNERAEKAEEVRVEQSREAKQSLNAANDRADEANRSAGQKDRELTYLQAELVGVRESLRLSNERAEKAEKTLAEKQDELKGASAALEAETASKLELENTVVKTAGEIWENAMEQFHLGYPDVDLSWMVIDGYVQDGALLQEIEEFQVLKLPFPGSQQ